MKPKWHDEDEKPQHEKRGSYLPDIARRRRQLGLAVTPEEHVRYSKGEWHEREATRASKAAILRDVMARYQRGEYAPKGPEVEYWRAHWAEEDARTGRWRHAAPAGSGTQGFTRLGDTIWKVFADLAAHYGVEAEREPGEDG